MMLPVQLPAASPSLVVGLAISRSAPAWTHIRPHSREGRASTAPADASASWHSRPSSRATTPGLGGDVGWSQSDFDASFFSTASMEHLLPGTRPATPLGSFETRPVRSRHPATLLNPQGPLMILLLLPA